MWKDSIENLYDKNDLIQGNKKDYKNSIIKFGRSLEDSLYIDNYIKRLNEKTVNGNISHSQKGLIEYRNTGEKNFKDSYFNVKRKFEMIRDYEDIVELMKFYESVKDESYFYVFDKHTCAGEINSFFNTKLRNAMADKNKKYYTVRCGGDNKHYNNFINNRMISITWNNMGNIQNLSIKELEEHYLKVYGNKNSVYQWKNVSHNMKIGDIVILIRKGTKSCDVAVITSELMYNENSPELYRNYRTFELLLQGVELDFVYKIQATFTKINDIKFIDSVAKLFTKEIEEKYHAILSNIDTARDFSFELNEDELLELNDNNTNTDVNEYVSNSKQLIIDGAPGTGKSYYVNNEIINKDGLEEMYNTFKEMVNTAQLLSNAMDNVDFLIDELNSFKYEELKILSDKYELSTEKQTVNYIRKNIVFDLIRGQNIDGDLLEEKLNSIKTWDVFGILMSLYYYGKKIDDIEKHCIYQINNYITELGIADYYKFNKVFTFQGSRSKGSNTFQLALLYEEFNPKKSLQLVIGVNNNGLELFIYDPKQEKRINQIDIKLTNEKDFADEFSTSVLNLHEQFVLINENKIVGKLVDLNSFVNNSKQLIIDGAPGTGKSYYVNNEIINKDSDYVNRVTFYPDYEYHNFIGNIIPKVEGNQVSYQFNKGNFTETLEHALCNPETKHYLVIEELSRGNAAAIFGDVFQLLDRNKNDNLEGWSEYEISNNSIYSNLCEKAQDALKEVYGENKVGIPKNMSIICTINSSDQNVYPLDTAFKRRFNYMIMSTESDNEDIKFDISLGKDNAIKQPWNEFYQKLNEFIIDKMELNEDKQIGPFFIRQGDETEEIQTKLAMYLWNDINKVHTMSNIKVFNNNIKTLAKLDQLFRNGTKEELHDILTEEFKECID